MVAPTIHSKVIPGLVREAEEDTRRWLVGQDRVIWETSRQCRRYESTKASLDLLQETGVNYCHNVKTLSWFGVK